MDGLSFESALPAVRSDPARADIACFVGFVNRRATAPGQRAALDRALRRLGWGPDGDVDSTASPLPPAARVLPDEVVPAGAGPWAFAAWLEGHGWKASQRGVAAPDLFARAAAALVGSTVTEWWLEFAWLSPHAQRSAADLLELLDVPVPINSWDAFDQLFAWDERAADDGRLVDTTLGAAVRRFFLQGGRKCYVVRVGDAWPLLTGRATRMEMIPRLLRGVFAPVPVDRTTWRGVGHVLGLPDASFLCLPDLPDLFASDTRPIPSEADAVPDALERFVECAAPAAPQRFRRPRPVGREPRCDADGFAEWSTFVRTIGSLIGRYSREVQFIAAVPLPVDAASLRMAPGMAAVPADDRDRVVALDTFAARRAQWEQAGRVQTAFVQLVYPWLETRESALLPGALEPPDALLAGLLASTALAVGAWRSAAHAPIAGVRRLEPTLTRADLATELPFSGPVGQRRTPRTLRDRISLVAPTPVGYQLLSDVTTDDDDVYRPASVNRLVASIVRAARLAGEAIVFMNTGEALWRRVQAALEEVLRDLWGAGALRGARAADAFDVRCDRSTMSQADIDGGRVIARVQFNAATPIEHIVVVLAMDEGGQVTLVSTGTAAVSA